MTLSIHDILMRQPLWQWLGDAILFVIFFVHLIFALLLVGIGIIEATNVLRDRWTPARAGLKRFFAVKSVAVVFGVGALLLFVVTRPYPVLQAVSFGAALWLGLILLLLVSFVLFEWIAESEKRTALKKIGAGTALAFLLAVPGTFALVVVAAESPAEWPTMIEHGLSSGTSFHWLWRYGHAVGAAIVLAAAFNFIRAPERRSESARWLTSGIALQVVGGLALLTTRAEMLSAPIGALLGLGALLALAVVVVVQRSPGLVQAALLNGALAGILLCMLVTRQLLQDSRIKPVQAQLEAQAAVQKDLLEMTTPGGFPVHQSFLEPAREPAPLYERSCLYCHGSVADGNGIERQWLAVPPEDLRSLRISSDVFAAILRKGVDGTGMPRFGFYTPDQLAEIEAFLVEAGMNAKDPDIVPEAARIDEARRYFAQTCAKCHGFDGSGGPLAPTFEVAPPNLQLLGLSPERAYEVISSGYPGTMMPAFDHLHPEVRQGLVAHVRQMQDPLQ